MICGWKVKLVTPPTSVMPSSSVSQPCSTGPGGCMARWPVNMRDVAVAAHLVAGRHDRLHRVRMMLGHPGGDEERGGDLGLAQEVEDARQGFQHAEGALGERDGLVDAAGQPQGLGVEVEREGAGRPVAMRPANGHREASGGATSERAGRPMLRRSPAQTNRYGPARAASRQWADPAQSSRRSRNARSRWRSRTG